MPRPIHEQVIVVIGASSGIGREACRQLGQAGATIVLAARNEPALHEAADEVRQAGGTAHVVPTDVTYPEDLEKLASETISTFGRIDTWVNDASTSVYAPVDETTLDEYEQILRVNLLGTINGCKAVLPYMRQQGYGTIINIGSVLSYVSVPLQSAYCAAKHGVLGFTDSLRMELKGHNIPINVSLVLPASINTPFFNHARSKLGAKPMPIPPAYSPKVAGSVIVYAAQHPRREFYVGGASRLFTLMWRLSPALTEQFLLIGRWAEQAQISNQSDDNRDNVFTPSTGQGRVRGDFGHLTKPSTFTRLIETTPAWTKLLVSALVFGVVALVRSRAGSND